MNTGHTDRRPGSGRRLEGSKEEKERRLQDAAVRRVKREGLEGLSFTTLVEEMEKDPEKRLNRGTPRHYFGTPEGLAAAVAERGFLLLAKELKAVRDSSRPGRKSLEKMATTYAWFGLEHEHLYRAMHAGNLWQAAAQRGKKKSSASEKRETTANHWVDRAEAARLNAFLELERAVGEAIRTGKVKPHEAGLMARAITAMVDGYLFQVLEERVWPDWTNATQVGLLQNLIGYLLDGISPSTV